MLQHLNDYDINQIPVQDLEDMPSSSADHSYYLKKMRKQARKEREEKAIYAREIPGHQGNKQVDELLEFIESSGGKKKKTTTSMNNSHSLPNNLSNKARKTVLKDGKKKSLSESHDHSSSETGSENGDELIYKVENVHMSNSGKDKSEDNGDESDTEDVSETGDHKEYNYSSSQIKVSYETVNAEYVVHCHISTSEVDSEEIPPAFVCTEEINTYSVNENKDNFIFTDIDVPPAKEDKFETVIHKKKKQRPANVFTAPYFEQRREPRYEERRRPVRSVTPPPNSIHAHVSSGERQADRALSPSAFPALPHGKGREGRRNSTGNVETLPNQDDSDLESVKSLPVSDRLEVASSSTSSSSQAVAAAAALVKPLPISYAKIAASPKPNPSSGQASPRIHSQPTDIEQQRRHSFSHHDHNSGGSSNEGSDLKGKNDAISRSQELPTSLEKAESSNSVSNTGYACVVKAKRKLSDEFGGTTAAQVSSTSSSSSSSSISQEKPVYNPAMTKTDRKLAATSYDSSSSTEGGKTVLPSMNSPGQLTSVSMSSQTQHKLTTSRLQTEQAMPKPELISNNRKLESTAANVVVNSNRPQHSQNKAANTAHNSTSKKPSKNTKNTKFLVFLDKKEGETPSDLGISFGFDECMPDMLENVPAQDIPAVDTTPDIIKNSSGALFCGGDNHRPVRPGIGLTFMDSSGIEPSAMDGGNNKGKANHNTGRVLPANLNGLVAPVSIPRGVGVTVPAWGRLNNSQIPAQQPSFLAEDFPPITKVDSKKVATPSHKGMYENTYLGTFSIEDAATFLIREWDRLVTRDSRGVESLTFSDQW